MTTTVKDLRVLVEDSCAALSARAQAAVDLLEQDETSAEVGLKVGPELIRAVANLADAPTALRLASQASAKRQLAAYEAVVAVWPEQDPQALSRSESPHSGFTSILATLGKVDHVYGALVAEYRYNMADPFFRNSPMFLGVWGKQLVSIFERLGEEAFIDWLRKMWWVDRNSAPNITQVLRAASIAAPPDPLRERLEACAASFEYPAR